MKETVRVAISGSRSITNKTFVFNSLDFFLRRLLEEYNVIIIHGNAKGVDSIANEWAIDKGLEIVVFEPEYGKYPLRVAPIKRNETIVENCDYLLAITTGSNGTASTINFAKKQNKIVKVITVGN